MNFPRILYIIYWLYTQKYKNWLRYLVNNTEPNYRS